MTQVLQDIRGTQDVDEEFSDICDACVEANKVKHRPCAGIDIIQMQSQHAVHTLQNPQKPQAECCAD